MPARSDDADGGHRFPAVGLSRPSRDDLPKLLGTLLLFGLGLALLAASVPVLFAPDPGFLLGWSLLMGGIGALFVGVRLFPLRPE